MTDYVIIEADFNNLSESTRKEIERYLHPVIYPLVWTKEDSDRALLEALEVCGLELPDNIEELKEQFVNSYIEDDLAMAKVNDAIFAEAKDFVQYLINNNE
jgi:hypothetical protein